MGGIVKKTGEALFGDPGKALKKFRPTMMSGGGFQSTLTGKKNNQTLNLTSDVRRELAIGGVQSALMGGADALAGQRGLVNPGFGALTEARVGALDSARRRATGTLRDNLSRRRVLGSSFAADAMGRVESEFGRQEAEVRAQSFLEELQLTTNLIERETQFRTNAMATALDSLNFEASLATQLATGATAAMQASASMQAQLAQMQIGQMLDVAGTLFGAYGPQPGGP
jgi:hypothetical protein